MFFTRLKRFLLGQPLPLYQATHETIPKWKALSTLSSDAVSSVAYATDAILFTLVAFSAASVIWSIPIAIAIVCLLVIVIASYRQTIDAYPTGGGAYTVAKENLGTYAGLVAGGALLIDYTLTVSVSVSAGVENIASAFPYLQEHRVGMGILVILFIMTMNLRGVRESATIFAFPTYFFILSGFLLIGMGLYKALTGQAVPQVPPIVGSVYPAVPAILILRAFASGCAALTGVEAISNSVAVFEPPANRNAKVTLVWMAVLLAGLFMGITLLAHLYAVVPREEETLISLLGRRVFGETFLYYALQVGTAFILFLAANTSYAGFPRLASLLAYDGFLPRQLTSLGDRLVFSNGVFGLSFAAGLLLAIFEGHTIRLIPLYAIGVFLSFTLSQAGMVAHHLREKEPGWRSSLLINGIGAVTTLVVLADLTATKFLSGAWIVVAFIPLMVTFFKNVHHHYEEVADALTLGDRPFPVAFKKIKHTVVIPISGVHQGVLEAVQYALSISQDVRVCYVELDPMVTEKVKAEWEKWAPDIPFVVLESPERSVIEPFIRYLDDVEETSKDDLVTVVIPEFVTSKWWHRFFHNNTAVFIRAALASKPRKVVTSVRYHLRGNW
ncbi:MAG TPA: APC family permease [Bdellovibrionota bacterium]|nr:APC family permease [Bdellovibrionota bacterium]